nr:MAG TPA: chitin synthase regulator [Caudoviricetes sp.]
MLNHLISFLNLPSLLIILIYLFSLFIFFIKQNRRRNQSSPIFTHYTNSN